MYGVLGLDYMALLSQLQVSTNDKHNESSAWAGGIATSSLVSCTRPLWTSKTLVQGTQAPQSKCRNEEPVAIALLDQGQNPAIMNARRTSDLLLPRCSATRGGITLSSPAEFRFLLLASGDVKESEIDAWHLKPMCTHLDLG